MVSTTWWYSRCLAGGVEVSEPAEGLVGLVEVFGLIKLVELLERVPRGSKTWMSLEEAIEMLLVGVCEMVGAALQLPAYQGEALGEPAGDVEPVQHMASIGKILRDGSLIRAGPVAHDYLHLPGVRPAGSAAVARPGFPNGSRRRDVRGCSQVRKETDRAGAGWG